MIVYITKAYLTKRDEILKILNNVKKDSINYSNAHNFITLFEFIIPTVSFFTILMFLFNLTIYIS